VSVQNESARQRVLMALAHEEPDRIPVDFGGMRSSGISAMAYQRLKDRLGMRTGEPYVYDVRQQLAIVEEPVRQRFNADVFPLDLDQLGDWQPYTLPDGSPAKTLAGYEFEQTKEGDVYWRDPVRRIARRPGGGFYFDYVYFPLAQARTPADLEARDWGGFTDAELEKLRTRAAQLFDESDYFILGRFGGSMYERGQDLRGWERFMLDMAEGGAFLEAFLEHLFESHMANLKRYLAAVGDYIQAINFSDDLGTQRALQISPAMYRRWIKPYHTRLYGYVREHYPHVHVFLHCCGAIYDLIPDLIEAGVQILNPVQTTARGMDPGRLKQNFGADLTFWGGGCDTQHVLPHGTRDEVRADVRRRLEILAPGGGYVFNPIHNVQPDVPPENVVAMFDAVREFGDG
jgi:uroporphyrinogen decarboxylase